MSLRLILSELGPVAADQIFRELGFVNADLIVSESGLVTADQILSELGVTADLILSVFGLLFFSFADLILSGLGALPRTWFYPNSLRT